MFRARFFFGYTSQSHYFFFNYLSPRSLLLDYYPTNPGDDRTEVKAEVFAQLFVTGRRLPFAQRIIGVVQHSLKDARYSVVLEENATGDLCEMGITGEVGLQERDHGETVSSQALPIGP
jgi:hypothetical protein